MKKMLCVAACLGMLALVSLFAPPASARQRSDLNPHLRALEDTDPVVRARAACALGEMEHRAEAAIPALLQLLGDATRLPWDVCEEDASRRNENRWNVNAFTSPGKKAAAALTEIGRAAVQPLLGILKHQQAHARRNAAWALGALDDRRAVEPLIAILNDTDADVREQTAWALGAIGDPRAIDGLSKALRDEDPDVREQTAWALGAIGDRRATDALLAALKDEDVDVRKQVAWALKAVQ